MIGVIGQLIPIYGLIFTGFALKAIGGVWAQRLRDALSFLLTNLLVPVICFSAIMKVADLQVMLWDMIATALLAYFASVLLAWLAAVVLRFSREAKGAFLLINTFPNTVFLGFPITYAMYGLEGLSYASMLAVVSALVMVTLGSGIGAYYSSGHGHLGYALRKVLAFPPFIASIVGLILLLVGVSYPDWLAAPVNLVSRLVTWLSLIFIGLNITLSLGVVRLRSVLGTALIRLLLVPLISFIIVKAMWGGTAWGGVVTILMGMPPAVVNIVYADHFGLDRELAAVLLMAVTVLALLTLPLLLYLSSLLTPRIPA